jgi:hypothetical protein
VDSVAQVAQGGEWPGEFVGGDQFLADVEGFEDGLVE